MSRTHRFVVDKLLKEPVTTSESTALANLAFLSTLPVLRDIPIDIFKSLPRDDSRRLLILAACSYARGFTLRCEPLATDSDWEEWLDNFEKL